MTSRTGAYTHRLLYHAVVGAMEKEQISLLCCCSILETKSQHLHLPYKIFRFLRCATMKIREKDLVVVVMMFLAVRLMAPMCSS